jgi:hypothetical protein
MDAHPAPRSAAASERTTAMAEMRRCIGSERFGIAAHDAPLSDFPKQPSQKDGLGRMCREHWSLYTRGLAEDAAGRKAAAELAAASDVTEPTADEAAAEEPTTKRARRAKLAPVAKGEEAAS